MITSREGASKGAPLSGRALLKGGPEKLLGIACETLDEAKALDIVSIDLEGKSSIADYMIVASGRSTRHVGAIAEQVMKALKMETKFRIKVEGLPHCDWVLIDGGDVIVHIFRPEVREFYNLEKMWSADRPDERVAN
jgi:ribosome-associated protein